MVIMVLIIFIIIFKKMCYYLGACVLSEWMCVCVCVSVCVCTYCSWVNHIIGFMDSQAHQVTYQWKSALLVADVISFTDDGDTGRCCVLERRRLIVFHYLVSPSSTKWFFECTATGSLSQWRFFSLPPPLNGSELHLRLKHIL